jgi:WD40 repeat protein
MLVSLHDTLRHTPKQLSDWSGLPLEMSQCVHVFHVPRLYTAYDATLRRYAGSILCQSFTYTATIEALQQSLDGQWLGVYTQKQTLYLWHTALALRHRVQIVNSLGVFYTIAFSPNSKYVAVNAASNVLHGVTVWDVHTGLPYATLTLANTPIHLIFTPDNQSLVGGGSNYDSGFQWHLNVHTKHYTTLPSYWSHTAMAVKTIENKLLIFSAGLDGFLRACCAQTKRLIYEQQLPQPAYDMICNHQGSQIALLSDCVVLCDAITGRILYTLKTDDLLNTYYFATVAASFTWDDALLITGGKHLAMWCTTTGTCLWMQACDTLITHVYQTLHGLLTAEEITVHANDMHTVRLWPCAFKN